MRHNLGSRLPAVWLALMAPIFAAESAVAGDCLLQGHVQFGDNAPQQQTNPAPDGSSIFFFARSGQQTPDPFGPRAFVKSGAYKCDECFEGTNLAVAFDPSHARVGEVQVVNCSSENPSTRTDLSFNTHGTSRLNRAVAGDERPGQHGHAYVVSGTVTKQRTADPSDFGPVVDGEDEIDCTAFATTEHGDLVPVATIRSPIVGTRFECPVATQTVKFSLASDAERDCYLPDGFAIPDQPAVPAAVDHDVTFRLEPVDPAHPDCGPAQHALAACNLTGTVRRGGAVPPASETIDCDLATTDSWQPINDATGAYTCSTQQGTVTLTLQSGIGGNKTCTCSDTTTVCNVSF